VEAEALSSTRMCSAILRQCVVAAAVVRQRCDSVLESTGVEAKYAADSCGGGRRMGLSDFGLGFLGRGVFAWM
jgi:hypothetical protein